MPKKNAINLNFGVEGIDKLIKEFVALQQAANAPTEKIEKILNDLYKLHDIAKNGTPITANSLQSIIGRLTQFGSQMRDSFSPEFVENLNKKIEELNNAIVNSQDELEKLKTKNSGLKQSKTKTTQKKEKLLETTLSSGLFKDEQELNEFKFKKNRKDTTGLEGDDLAFAEHWNKQFDAAKKYFKELEKIDDKLKTIEKDLKNNKDRQKELNTTIKTAKETLEETISGTTASGLGQAGGEAVEVANQLRKATSEAGVTGNSLVQLNTVAADTSSVFGKLTQSLIGSRVILGAIRKVLKGSLDTIKEMDGAITNMAVVTGQSREELWGMTQEFKNMGQQAGSTMTEMASLTTEYIRQGRSMSDAKSLAIETAKAAKIAGISVSDSLTYMTSAINGFNLAADAASRVSDIFARVAAVSATDYNQLAVALSKVSAQANQAGMSIEYTTALLAKGIETTQEAPESIGTALKTIIARFRELSDYGSTLEDGMNVNKVEAALAAVGIELRNESGEFRNLTDVLNELGPKWDSLNTMQRQAIAQAAAGTRQQSRFLAIMQDWERTMVLVSEAEDSAGASAAQYAQYAKGLEAQMTNLKTTWQEFTTQMVNTEVVLNGLKRLSDFLNNLTEAKGLMKTVQILLVTITTISLISKAGQKYDQFKINQAAKLSKIVSGQSLEEELQLKLAKSSTAEFTKHLALKKQILTTNYAIAKQEKEAALDALAKTDKFKIDQNTKMALGDSKEALQYNAIQKELNALEKSYTNQIEIIDKYDSAVNLNNATIKRNQSLWQRFKGIFKSHRKEAKDMEKSSKKFKLSGQAIATAAAAVAVAVVGVINTVQELKKDREDYLSEVNEIYGSISESQTTNKNLQSLTEEYTLLQQKTHKTAEDLERIDEINSSIKGGDYGENVSSIEDAYKEINANQQKMAQEYTKLMGVVVKASEDGVNVWDDSEFVKVMKNFGKQSVNIRVTDAQSSWANKQAQEVMEHVDYQQLYQTIDAKTIMANTPRGNYGGEGTTDWFTAFGKYGVPLITAGATIGAGFAGIGGVIGAAIGAAAGVIAASIETWHKNSERYAERQAQEVAKEWQAKIRETGKAASDFAIRFSEVYDQNLATQLDTFSDIISDYSPELQKAIEGANAGLATMREIGLTGEKLAKLQGLKGSNAITDSEINAIYDALAVFGEDAASQFTDIWMELIDKGYSQQEALAAIYSMMTGGAQGNDYGVSSTFDTEKYTEQYVAEAQKKADDYVAEGSAYKQMEEVIFSSKKKDQRIAKNMALNAGFETAEAYWVYLQQEYNKLSADAQNAAAAARELQSSVLSGITTYTDFNSLSQALTGVNSVITNLKDFSNQLAEGTISLEDLSAAASNYSDVFGSEEMTKLIEAGDLEGIENLLMQTATLESQLEKQNNLVNDFILGVTKTLEEEIYNNLGISRADFQTQEDYDAAVEQKLRSLEIGSLQDQGTAKQIRALMAQTTSEINAAHYWLEANYNISEQDKKNRVDILNTMQGEAEVAKGLLSGYEKLLTVAKNDTIEKQKQLDTFKNSEPEFAKIYDAINQGNWALYDSLDDTQKQLFKIYMDTLDAYQTELDAAQQEELNKQKEYQDKVIEIQNEAMDAYKENLKKETDELKKQIDKRKEYYEDFFDLLEEEEKTDDYETERTRLLNTISSLSTARDASSLARLKEAQAELAELEKEQRSNEREARKEATLNALDSLSEQVDEEYEKTVENNAAIWDAFQEKGDDVMLSMIKKWKMAVDGYDKMTEAERKQWDTDWATYVRSYDTASSASDLTDTQIAELSKSGEISTANDTNSKLWNYDPTPTTEDNSEYNSLVIENLNLELPSVTDGETFVRDFPQLLLEVKRNSGQTINSKN